MNSQILTIDVRASGVLQGAGPLYNVLAVEVTEELDKAGQVVITLPATDARAIELVAGGRQVDVRTENGIVASGIIDEFEAVSETPPVYRLTGTDLLGELNYLNTGLNRVYNNLATSAAIIGTHATTTSLLGGTGWTQGTVTIDPSVTPWSITFDSETRLSALINLAAEIGHHFRQGSTARTLDFGVFGADSGYYAIGPRWLAPGIDAIAGKCVISTVSVNQITAFIENRVFPVGREGFDLRDAPITLTDIYVRTDQGPAGAATTTDGTTSGTTVPVTATTGFAAGSDVWIGDADDWTADHEYGTISSVNSGISITVTSTLANTYAAGVDVLQRPQFYVENAASQALYGVRESYPQFGWIGPGSTAVDATLQTQFATSLYYAAKAHLARYKDLYKAYTLGDVYNVPHDLRVGDKIYVTYRGAASPFSTSTSELFVNVNNDFYVMKITRRWDGAGTGGALGVATLDIANVARPSPVNQNLLVYLLGANRWIGPGK